MFRNFYTRLSVRNERNYHFLLILNIFALNITFDNIFLICFAVANVRFVVFPEKLYKGLMTESSKSLINMI
jgi:hypothetical protein